MRGRNLFVKFIVIVFFLLCIGSNVMFGKTLERKLIYLSRCVSTSQQSIEVDSTGNIHIAYGGDHLYYATLTNGNLKKQIVDNDNFTGSKPILLIDSQNNPHILYFDKLHRILKYAYNNGKVWKINAIGTCDIKSPKSLSIDTHNNPHIAYYYNKEIKYIYYNGKTWTKGKVEPNKELSGAYYIALYINEKNQLFVAYVIAEGENDDTDLKYNFYDGAKWDLKILDSGDIGNLSLVVDSKNAPHIAYVNGSGNINYAYLNGNQWKIENGPNISDGLEGGIIALAIDENGNPGLAYTQPFGYSMGILKYAHKVDDNWNVETVKERKLTKYYASSLFLDKNGIPYILSSVYTGHDINFLYVLNGKNDWSESLVDESSLVNFGYPFALDSKGYPHFIFWKYDGTYKLIYSYYDGKIWHFIEIPNSQNTERNASYASLNLDSSNMPHIAFFDYDKGLCYAHFDGNNWDMSIVDRSVSGSSSWENYAKIILNSNGIPCIVYYNLLSKNINYACYNGNAWRKVTIDNYGHTRAEHNYPYARFDDSGALIISYFSYLNGKLSVKVAKCKSYNCNINNFNYGEYNNQSYVSVSLDKYNIPRFLFYDDADTTLKYAVINNGKWKITKVDNVKGGSNGYLRAFLRLDQTGNPHIVYMTNSDLKYAYFSNNKWDIDDVSSSTYDFNMILNKNGSPYIIYQENGALYYAYKETNAGVIFSDISPDDWYYSSIISIANAGISTGYPDGTFKPSNNVTRAQMAAFIARAMKLNVYNQCVNPPFNDVAANKWFCPYVEAIKDAGITQGTSNGYYDPEGYVTRAQMAAFLSKALGLNTQPCTSKPFSDVPTDAWYCPYVKAIKDAQLTTGYPDGTFKPNRYVTRAEMAVFLERGFLK